MDELIEDYNLDFGMFSDLDDRLLEMEDNWNNLNQSERNLVILYAELGSFRKVGNVLNITHSTVRKYFNQIKTKLC